MQPILTWGLTAIERFVFRQDYPLKTYFGYRGRFSAIAQWIAAQLQERQNHEIWALIRHPADERMLLPILLHVLDQIQATNQSIEVHLVLLKPINDAMKAELIRKGCYLETHLSSFLKPCANPTGKVALFCLDQHLCQPIHQQGVEAAATLTQFGVKTVSIQHGGTRADTVRELASSASQTILVWGQRVLRELVERYQVQPERLRLVGNHLHDRIPSLDREHILTTIEQYHPSFTSRRQNRKVVLLATCLHSEYANRDNETELYQRYIQHLYQSLDFSQVCLLIKMHPSDQTNPSLYWEYMPEHLKSSDSIFIIEPHQNLDAYSLLYISDLLITRASTMAEEGLLLKKNVIAFDLDAEGPARAYQHLEEYGGYQTVYATPPDRLSHAVNQAISEDSDALKNREIEQELTYALDGRSLERTATTILQLLYS